MAASEGFGRTTYIIKLPKSIPPRAPADLSPNGMIAAVDFHDSPVALFKTWMQINLVRMDSHLLPELSLNFHPDTFEVRSAYGGIWKYFLYLGKKL